MHEERIQRCCICHGESNLDTDLCWRCTDGLAAFNRNPERLRRAAEFLQPASREKRIKVIRDDRVVFTVIDSRGRLYEK